MGFQAFQKQKKGEQHEQRLRGRIIYLEWRKHVKEPDELRETKLRKAWSTRP